VFWFVANGIHMPAWRPDTEGPGYDLKRVLEPLAPIQDKVSVLTGLANMTGRVPRPGDHARGTASFLTCATPEFTSDASSYVGQSVDQLAAEGAGDDTLFPSLQLGLEGGVSSGTCDSGYPCAYQRNISWADATTPLPKIHDPRTAFERLFGGLADADPEAAARRRALRLSILDAVREDAGALQRNLGRSDAAKLDQYLTGVREVEQRIQALEDQACDAPEAPARGLDVPARAEAMSRLIVAALQCDMTRVVSHMFANGASGRNHSWIEGASGNHHGISHHQNNPAQHEKLVRINRWEVEVFVRFLQQLDAVEEADGQSLLDHCAVLFGSEISDGNRHNHDDMPLLLAGSAGGRLRTGEHRVYSNREPVANLYLVLLEAFGVAPPDFGDSTRRLPGIVA